MERGRTVAGLFEAPELDPFFAWRHWMACENEDAIERASIALSADIRPELCLQVLVDALVAEERLPEAAKHQLELLTRFPSEGRLRRGLKLALQLKSFPAAREMFDAYPELIAETAILLVRAEIEENEGSQERCLATLHAVARDSKTLSESDAMRALSIAERTCKRLVPHQFCERILNLLEALRSRTDGSDLLLAQAAYFLRANLNDECEALLGRLPHDPRSEAVAATLWFRRGEFQRAVVHGGNALEEGQVSPELLACMIESAGALRDLQLLRALWGTHEVVVREWPELLKLYERVRKELGDG